MILFVHEVMPLPYKRGWHIQRQGAWRTLVDKVKAAKKRGSLTTPVQELNFATYHLLALMKLRNYGAAVDELAALGDLDAPHYSYDEYPSVYPGKSGPMSFCKICLTGCPSCAQCRLCSLLTLRIELCKIHIRGIQQTILCRFNGAICVEVDAC